MEMLIIFWIGMYFLFEILSFVENEIFLIDKIIQALNPFNNYIFEFLENLIILMFIFITVPFIALYFSYSWIKDKR